MAKHASPLQGHMKTPKILAVASAIDLDFRYGCTPAWWQLWKGMYEAGVDLIVTPYRGRPVESPWWRVAPNPTYREGESYQAVRDVLARVKGDRYLRRDESHPEESGLDRLTRETIQRWVTPRWRRHLERLIERERPDAVVIFTVPMAHLRGVPDALRSRFGIPIVFYDGDVPMSLPEYGGWTPGSTRTTAQTRGSTTSCCRTPRAGYRVCSSSARGGPTCSTGAPIPSSSRPNPSRRRWTSSSTATATSSAGTG